MPVETPRSVTEYLRGLDRERRTILSAVRKVVNQHLPDGCAEGVTYGMIAWHHPLETFPGTDNGHRFVARLAAQNNFNTL